MNIYIDLTEEQVEQLQEIADLDSGGSNTSIEYFVESVVKEQIQIWIDMGRGSFK